MISPTLTTNQIVMIPIKQIDPHPDNPRKSLGDLSELSESIKAKGILQNLTVVPWFNAVTGEKGEEGRYYVLIGHRRLAASRCFLKEVPCVISEMTRGEQIATMLVENVQRSDLTVYEQAQSFKQLRMDFGESVESIAQKTGFSETTIRRRLKVAELDKELLKEACENYQIKLEDAEKVCELTDESARNAVLQTIGTKNFDNKLEVEINNQKRKEKLSKLEENIKEFATTKLSNRPNFSDETWIFVRAYGIYSDTLPQKPDYEANFAYYVDYSLVAVYADNIPSLEEDEEEIHKKEDQQARLKECEVECNALRDRAYNRRVLFVKNLKVDKPMLIKVNKWALKKANDYCSGIEQRIKRFSKGLEDNAGNKDILAAYETDPYKLIFLLMYCRCNEDAKNSYISMSSIWSGSPDFCNNKTLNDIYDILLDFGYELSDEEEQLMNGTHPIYEKDFLEGIE